MGRLRSAAIYPRTASKVQLRRRAAMAIRQTLASCLIAAYIAFIAAAIAVPAAGARFPSEGE